MVADQCLGHFHVPQASLPQIQDWNYLIKTHYYQYNSLNNILKKQYTEYL
jgi:hypothetical protein